MKHIAGSLGHNIRAHLRVRPYGEKMQGRV